MHRLLFTIAAQATGWQLYEGDEGKFWFSRWDDALETADIMAGALHERHGIPTAVVMDMAGREAVLVSSHG
ncbi:hypothetical protein [Pseudoxanthomonas kalamensis]|uniref:hypothetical protein n=1 Tax=Pseudoxanthomonas kalamensis TaxID=289483 RepID=UPI00139126BA|nr:hypothetical protein [Pseudoxanthomonas kalamensis]